MCSITNFSFNYIKPGTTSIKKDSIKSHCLSEPHKRAADLEFKSKLGDVPYMESVMENAPIGRSIKRMCAEDENACCVLFNSTYYFVKQERPLSDFPNLLKLQEKNCTPGIKKYYRNDRPGGNFLDVIGKVTMDSLQANAHYFRVLSDGSTDRSVIEEELVSLLFLKSRKPPLKSLLIEPANNANAEGIIECIKTAFERIDVLDFHKEIMGLNVDGASVNSGMHNGVGVLMQADSP